MQRGLCILVVDDEPLIALASEAVLASYGHQVLLAPSMKAALARAELLPSLDLAVIDLHLADGSGAELIDKLRARWPGLPVVLSTAYDLDAGELLVLEPALGRTVILTKPWNEAEFVNAVAEVARPAAPTADVRAALSAGPA